MKTIDLELSEETKLFLKAGLCSAPCFGGKRLSYVFNRQMSLVHALIKWISNLSVPNGEITLIFQP